MAIRSFRWGLDEKNAKSPWLVLALY